MSAPSYQFIWNRSLKLAWPALPDPHLLQFSQKMALPLTNCECKHKPSMNGETSLLFFANIPPICDLPLSLLPLPFYCYNLTEHNVLCFSMELCHMSHSCPFNTSSVCMILPLGVLFDAQPHLAYILFGSEMFLSTWFPFEATSSMISWFPDGLEYLLQLYEDCIYFFWWIHSPSEQDLMVRHIGLIVLKIPFLFICWLCSIFFNELDLITYC